MKFTHRIILMPLLLVACGLEDLEAIVDKYEAISDASSGDTGSSSGAASEGSPGEGSSGTTTDTSTGGADTSTGGAVASASGEGSGTSTGTSTGGDPSTGTTTSPAVCGDEVVDPGEECDDGNDNDNDGCKQCWRDRLVFATSEEYQGHKLGGLMTADARCRMKAAQAGLPNVLTYTAWLSDSTHAVADRMLHSKGRYVLVNGLAVAADWDALISGTLEHPINVTEKSETSESFAWTGSLANGQPAFGSTFCGDWDDEDAGLEEGGTGINKQTDSEWSFYDMGGCFSIAVLYCFEN